MDSWKNPCMDGFVDELERTIHKHIVDAMPSGVRGSLASLSLSDLMIQYVGWRARLIPARPRRCHRSVELAASPKATEHQAELDAIVAKISAAPQQGHRQPGQGRSDDG